MAFLLCKRFTSGPNCSDNRLERTPAEKEDCIKKAMLECIAETWDNRLESIYDQSSVTLGLSSYAPGCLGDQEFYPWTCIDKLRDCYCTGLAGLTCTLCDADANGIGFGGVDEPDKDDDDDGGGGGTKYGGASKQTLTLSTRDENIPIAFGKVSLTGNIIWTSRPFAATVTTVKSSGASNYVTTRNVRNINFNLALSEGPLDAAHRVWFGDLLVYDLSTKVGPVLDPSLRDRDVKFTWRNGSEAQKVSKIVAEAEGFGKVPAYRGVACLQVENYGVEIAGTSLPTIRVEVVSEIEGGAATHSTGTDTGLLSARIAVDTPSGRLAIPTSSSIGVYSSSTLQKVNEVLDTPVASTLSYDGLNGSLVYQGADLDLHYISAQNYDEDRALSLAYTADLTSAYSFATNTLGKISVVFATNDGDINMYRVNHDTASMSFIRNFSAASLGNANPYKLAVIDDFQTGGEENPDIRAYFIAQDTSVKFFNYRLYCRQYSVGYDESRAMTAESFSPTVFGCRKATATLQSVVSLSGYSQFLLFFQDGGQYVAACVEHGSINDPLWSVRLPAAPVGSLVARHRGTTYKFISGNFLYSVDLDTGEYTREYTLSTNGAPALGQAQYYDHLKNATIYVNSSGALSAVYPDRLAWNPSTMDFVVEEVLERAGLAPTEYDLTGLTTSTLDGFLVFNQPSAASVLQDLSEFFGLVASESGGKIKITTLAASSPVSIDGDESLIPTTKRSALDFEELHHVKVAYFDVDRDSTLYNQTVSIDMLRGGEDSESLDGFEYSINVFTNGDAARRSAEISLLRRVQNSVGYTAHLSPKYMALEPNDIIVAENGTKLRINKVTFGVGSLSSDTQSSEDDPSLYADSAVLSGVVLDPTTSAITDNTVIATHPVMITLPHPADTRRTSVWMGAINPDGAFTSFGMSMGAPSDSILADVSPVSEEAKIGILTAAPLSSLGAVFRTRDDDGLTIKFSKNVDLSMFPAATNVDLYESYTRNLLSVGKELIQYKNASVGLDNRTVTFSGLLRGRFGTDRYVDQHYVGERCALYSANAFSMAPVTKNGAEDGMVLGYIESSFEDKFTRPDVASPGNYVESGRYAPSDIYMKIKKVTTGTSTLRGIRFMVLPRNANVDEFSDSSQSTAFIGRLRPIVFFLKAPYDEDLFMSNYLLGGYPMSSVIAASSNAYIRRAVVVRPNFNFPSLVTEATLFGDSYSYTSDLHLAVGLHLDGAGADSVTMTNIVGRPTGFKAEGAVNYTNYTQLLRYYV